jgi:hypothetical protein
MLECYSVFFEEFNVCAYAYLGLPLIHVPARFVQSFEFPFCLLRL